MINKHPLLQSQQGVFVESISYPESTQYNIPLFFELPADVDLNRLIAAWQIIFAQKSVFKLRFGRDDAGEPYQWYDETMEIPVQCCNCLEQELSEKLEKAIRPFAVLSGEPLVRVILFITEHSKYMLVDCYHTIFDGASFSLLCQQELPKAYAGEPVAKDMGMLQETEKEAARLNSTEYQAAKAYFQQNFADVDFVSFGNTGSTLGKILMACRYINKQYCDEWCREQGISPITLFQAAFNYCLGMLAGQEKVAYGMAYHNRYNEVRKDTLGMYACIVPVLTLLTRNISLKDYFVQVKQEQKAAVINSVYPVNHLWNDCKKMPRINFSFNAGKKVNLALQMGEHSCIPTFVKRTTLQSDLRVYVLISDEGYKLLAESSSEMNEQGLLEKVVEAFKNCVLNMMAHPEAKLGEISLLSETQQLEILQLSRGETLKYNTAETWIDMFQKQALAHAAAVAVVDSASRLTYAELDEQSDAVASYLVNHGVRSNDFVAIKMGRVKEFIAAIIGVQKAGAAYVPVDPDYPAERIAYMLEDCAAGAVIDEKLIAEIIESEGQAEFTSLAKPDNYAYMIYTSGSTGRPKGAVVYHRGVRAFVAWQHDFYHYSPDSKNVIHPSFSFDASINDIFPPLAAGGQVHIFSAEIRHDMDGMYNYIKENGITGMTMSTQIGMAMVNTYDLPMEFVAMGGEKVLPMRPQNLRVVNVYGPTEFTCISAAHDIDLANEKEVPIGKSVPNTMNLVCDQYGNLLPIGAIGELCLAGIQIGAGYWKRPEKTAEVFVDCPFMPGEKMYRTGDLVRYDANGDLIYMGRTDFQVKLRGFRIELGEIENRGAAYAGIAQVSAQVKKDQLVLYYTSEGEIDKESLKQFMAETLTDYMVPTVYMQLDRMPMTPGGKIDCKALPEPKVALDEIIAPETELEKQLFSIVKEQLKTEGFGVSTNLISIGMSSLLAMKLVAAINIQLSLQLRVTDIMKNPEIRSLAAVIKSGEEQQGHQGDLSPASDREYYPITENQRGIYIDWERNRTTTQYNIPALYKFTAKNADKLAKAVSVAIAAHCVLNTSFAVINGDIRQKSHKEANAAVLVQHLYKKPTAEFFQARIKPFDLFNDRLYRAEIYVHGEEIYLFLDFHHIVYDGISAQVMLRDILSAYDGKALRMEKINAYDFAVYENNLLNSAVYTEAEDFFADMLTDAVAVSYPDSKIADGNSLGSIEIQLASEQINQACAEAGVTVSSYLQAAFAETLQRLTREKRPMYLTISNGREADARLADCVGMFVKTLPVALYSSSQGRVTSFAYAKACHDKLQKIIDINFYPYTRLVEKHGLKGGIMFIYQGGVTETSMPEAEQLPLNLDTAKLPITVLVYPADKQYTINIEYDGMRYGQSDMKQLAEAVGNMALSMAKKKYMDECAVLADEQRDSLIKLSAGEKLEYDASETWVDMFKRQADAHADDLAVVDCVSSITYGELDNKSDAVAFYLSQHNVQPNDFVAIKMGRVKEFAVAVLGIQKAGAAYVPVDLEYPEERVAYMLADSGAKLVLTEDMVAEIVASLSVGELPAVEGGKALVKPDNYAYMIYTSGSTGNPKGVVQTHHSLRAFVAWRIKELGINQESRHAHHTSFSFDASLDDLICPLAAGGQVHILSESIRRDMAGMKQYFDDNNITAMAISAQMGMAMLNHYPDMNLHFISVGGEKLLPFAKTDVKVINEYGPTEFTVCSSFHVVNQNIDEDIPIGRPVPNTYSFICDSQGQLLPQGMAGELCLAGPQLSNGYWQLPEKTARVFVDCPFLPGQRMYRTGDLARYNEKDELEYMGRIDFQVKLRGFRIELGEVENRAAAYAGIKQVSAQVKKEQLILYYTAAEEISKDAFKQFMAETLTEYMVPNVFIQLPEMPLTPGGKIDRKALLAIETVRRDGQTRMPKTALENTIIEAMGKTLELQDVYVTDNFFAMGGTSLTAAKFIMLLKSAECSIEYQDVFDHQTPMELAAYLEGKQNAVMAQYAVPEENSSWQADKDLAETLQYNTIAYADQVQQEPLGNVLLTGATGFLGVHVLKELLESDAKHIICLLRRGKQDDLVSRLQTYLVYYFDDDFAAAFQERIKVIEGDITAINLQQILAGIPLDTVINCAASVKHYAKDNSIERVNVEGVGNLIELAKDKNAKLIQISTTSVPGAHNDDTYRISLKMKENQLFVIDDMSNQYIKSKYKAERLLLRAVKEDGLRGKIIRVGNLMGRYSDGEIQINMRTNAFLNGLRGFASIGKCPISHATDPMGFSPIDCTAKVVVLLASTNDIFTAFNADNRYCFDEMKIIAAANRNNIIIKPVSDQEYYADFKQRLANTEQNQKLAALMTYDRPDVHMVETDNRFTANILYRLGFSWPFIDDEYLDKVITSLKTLGFFS